VVPIGLLGIFFASRSSSEATAAAA